MEFLEDYTNEMERRIDDGLAPSKAFISYYLNLFFRFDYGDERDYICDIKNDRGLDAIYINDEIEEVYFIQSKFGDSTKEQHFISSRKIGEKEPSHFLGSIEKFKTKEGINAILESVETAQELKDLITYLKLSEKVHYSFRKIFITNGEHNQHSRDVENSTEIEFILMDSFQDEYKRYINIINATKTESIDFSFYPVNKTVINSAFDSIICLMKVRDLVKIDGINDYSVFTENVRGWLGKNRVFKAISSNLNDPEYDQSKNILYHNGITIICSSIEYENDKVTINDLSIVNGCQSTYAFYKNKDKLINRNHILVKIISLKDHPAIDKKNIVHFSNNQIAVKASDLISLSDNSVFVKNIFLEKDSEWCVKIKDGKDTDLCSDRKIIKLAQLAQYIASLYNVGHVKAANKNKLVETSYYEVFNGIEYEHMKIAIIFSDLFDEATQKLKESQTDSQERLLNSFHLTKLFFLASIKHILFTVHNVKSIEMSICFASFSKDRVKECILNNYLNMIIDLTSYLVEKNWLIDYKSILKSNEKSELLMKELVKEYQKNILKTPLNNLHKTIFE